MARRLLKRIILAERQVYKPKELEMYFLVNEEPPGPPADHQVWIVFEV